MIKCWLCCGADSCLAGTPGRMRTLKEGNSMKQTHQIIIIVLAVAVAVLGYLYYERTQNDIVIKIPNIQINP